MVSSFLNITFYNINDGQLYSTKNPNKKIIHRLDDSNIKKCIIMQNHHITVESSKLTVKCIDLKHNNDNNNDDDDDDEKNGLFLNIKDRKKKDNKKLEWLLQCKASETIKEQQPQQNSSDKEPTSKQIQQENNKKYVQRKINHLYTDLNYTCQTELIPIDMIGIIKNNEVYCIECCSMTILDNYQPFICNRHRDLYHPTPQQQLQEDKIIETRGRKYNHLKYQLHPNDIVSTLRINRSPLSGDIETKKCSYCNFFVSRVRITVMSHYFKIIKITLCKECYRQCESSDLKYTLQSLETIYNALQRRKF